MMEGVLEVLEAAAMAVARLAMVLPVWPLRVPVVVVPT
jgi:hypothetical protein